MAENYAADVVRLSTAKICHNLGFTTAQSSSIDILNDATRFYLSRLCQRLANQASLCGRILPTLDDLGVVFYDLQISLPELSEFIRDVAPDPLSNQIPHFPVKYNKQRRMNGKVSEKELKQRPDFIPIFFPPQHPDWFEEKVFTTAAKVQVIEKDKPTEKENPSGFTTKISPTNRRSTMSEIRKRLRFPTNSELPDFSELDAFQLGLIKFKTKILSTSPRNTIAPESVANEKTTNDADILNERLLMMDAVVKLERIPTPKIRELTSASPSVKDASPVTQTAVVTPKVVKLGVAVSSDQSENLSVNENVNKKVEKDIKIEEIYLDSSAGSSLDLSIEECICKVIGQKSADHFIKSPVDQSVSVSRTDSPLKPLKTDSVELAIGTAEDGVKKSKTGETVHLKEVRDEQKHSGKKRPLAATSKRNFADIQPMAVRSSAPKAANIKNSVAQRPSLQTPLVKKLTKTDVTQSKRQEKKDKSVSPLKLNKCNLKTTTDDLSTDKCVTDNKKDERKAVIPKLNITFGTFKTRLPVAETREERSTTAEENEEKKKKRKQKKDRDKRDHGHKVKSVPSRDHREASLKRKISQHLQMPSVITEGEPLKKIIKLKIKRPIMHEMTETDAVEQHQKEEAVGTEQCGQKAVVTDKPRVAPIKISISNMSTALHTLKKGASRSPPPKTPSPSRSDSALDDYDLASSSTTPLTQQLDTVVEKQMRHKKQLDTKHKNTTNDTINLDTTNDSNSVSRNAAASTKKHSAAPLPPVVIDNEQSQSKDGEAVNEEVWVCPVCSVAYVEGATDMIGCDACDNWFHWSCVGLIVAPPDKQPWFCNSCARHRGGSKFAASRGAGARISRKGLTTRKMSNVSSRPVKKR